MEARPAILAVEGRGSTILGRVSAARKYVPPAPDRPSSAYFSARDIRHHDHDRPLHILGSGGLPVDVHPPARQSQTGRLGLSRRLALCAEPGLLPTPACVDRRRSILQIRRQSVAGTRCSEATADRGQTWSPDRSNDARAGRTGHNRIDRLRQLTGCQRASSNHASGGACQALDDLPQIRPAVLDRFVGLSSLHLAAPGGVRRA